MSHWTELWLSISFHVQYFNCRAKRVFGAMCRARSWDNVVPDFWWQYSCLLANRQVKPRADFLLLAWGSSFRLFICLLFCLLVTWITYRSLRDSTVKKSNIRFHQKYQFLIILSPKHGGFKKWLDPAESFWGLSQNLDSRCKLDYHIRMIISTCKSRGNRFKGCGWAAFEWKWMFWNQLFSNTAHPEPLDRFKRISTKRPAWKVCASCWYRLCLFFLLFEMLAIYFENGNAVAVNCNCTGLSGWSDKIQ